MNDNFVGSFFTQNVVFLIIQILGVMEMTNYNPSSLIETSISPWIEINMKDLTMMSHYFWIT